MASWQCFNRSRVSNTSWAEVICSNAEASIRGFMVDIIWTSQRVWLKSPLTIISSPYRLVASAADVVEGNNSKHHRPAQATNYWLGNNALWLRLSFQLSSVIFPRSKPQPTQSCGLWPANVIMLSDGAVVYRTLTYCTVRSSRPKSQCLCYCQLCQWCCHI